MPFQPEETYADVDYNGASYHPFLSDIFRNTILVFVPLDSSHKIKLGKELKRLVFVPLRTTLLGHGSASAHGFHGIS